jgi:hypothetical protein
MRKNLFITSIIILLVNFASAQKTRFGFTAGGVAATMFEKVGGKTSTSDYRFGATAGILLDVPMQRHGSFQPAMTYTSKGGRGEFTQGTQTGKVKTNLEYIELLLNVVFRIHKGNGNIILGGGPATGIAISGKRLFDIGNSVGKETLEFGDATTDDFGEFDFGLNGLAGYEFKSGFFISANYCYGINRLFVGGDPKDKLFNRYFALRLGILIGGKK